MKPEHNHNWIYQGSELVNEIDDRPVYQSEFNCTDCNDRATVLSMDWPTKEMSQ